MKHRIAALFSEGVEVACGAIPTTGDGLYALLFDEEKAQLERAVDKRRREYAKGRMLAREAFERFSVVAAPLLNDADRVPQWPDGYTGTISHTKAFGVAVVASTRTHLALGIDVEPASPLRPRLFDHICSLSEREALASGPLSEPEQNARLLFSAKEAFYKCQYTQTRTYLGFHDVELTFVNQEFVVQFGRDVAGIFSEGDTMRGRYFVDDAYVVTACETLV